MQKTGACSAQVHEWKSIRDGSETQHKKRVSKSHISVHDKANKIKIMPPKQNNGLATWVEEMCWWLYCNSSATYIK